MMRFAICKSLSQAQLKPGVPPLLSKELRQICVDTKKGADRCIYPCGALDCL